MPSTMVHLMAAHELEPDGSGFYWVGSFAPDYTNDMRLKDKIHLRGNPDRWDLLQNLYPDIDKGNAFERAWFLHLFVDACWDESLLLEYKNWYMSANADENWFPHYRKEIGALTYSMYHTLPWAKNVWDSIRRAQLGEIKTSLPITAAENEQYRDMVVNSHSTSEPGQKPIFYTMDKIEAFTASTADRYKKWVSSIT